MDCDTVSKREKMLTTNLISRTVTLHISHENYILTAECINFGHGWIVDKLNPHKGQGWNELHPTLRGRIRKEVEIAAIEWCRLEMEQDR